MTPASTPVVPARAALLPDLDPLPPRDVVVGVGRWVVSADRTERLVTYALGSALAVTVYDPLVGVGGLLHAVAPSAASGTGPASQFVDAGMKAMVRAAYRLGASRARLVVTMVGGAEGDGPNEIDQEIGPENVQSLRRLLWRNGVSLSAEATGGRGVFRTASLVIANGEVQVKVDGRVSALSAGA